MYAYIKGMLAAVRTESVVLENNGIGYNVLVPANFTEGLSIGDEVTAYTHFSVREDAMQLFGFRTEDELGIFRLLLTVSGIGPKGALGVLTGMSADELRFAVLADDAAAIAKAPGIGKKTAQKIILELKDKLNLEEAFEKKTAAEWDRIFTEADIPHSICLTYKELLTDPQVDAIGVFQKMNYPTNPDIKVARQPVTIGGKLADFDRGPYLGEHTEEVLRGLGYSDEELKEMHEAGVYNTWEDLKEKLNG